MRTDDLRTIAYRALLNLGDRLVAGAPGQPPELLDLFEEARQAGLIDFDQRGDGTLFVFPLASKPPTQVATPVGIDSHKGMGST